MSNLPPNYRVCSDGRVYKNYRQGWKEKRQSEISGGYVATRINGKLRKVHRLVATEYIPNPNNLPQVNHIDGNKKNNQASNLEWVDNKTNAYHAMSINAHSNPAKAVVGVHKDGTGLFLRSLTEAEHYGFSRPNIGKVLKGERKKAHDFYWFEF